MFHKVERYIDLQLETLSRKCSFLHTHQFDYVIWVGMLLQPVAIWTQAFKAWTAPSIDGISIVMFVMLLGLQASGTFRAIKRTDAVLFIAMLGAFFGSIITLAALLVR